MWPYQTSLNPDCSFDMQLDILTVIYDMYDIKDINDINYAYDMYMK